MPSKEAGGPGAGSARAHLPVRGRERQARPSLAPHSRCWCRCRRKWRPGRGWRPARLVPPPPGALPSRGPKPRALHSSLGFLSLLCKGRAEARGGARCSPSRPPSPGARHPHRHGVRGGAPPLGRVPRARAAVRGLEAGVEHPRDQHGGVPPPEAGPPPPRLHPRRHHGERPRAGACAPAGPGSRALGAGEGPRAEVRVCPFSARRVLTCTASADLTLQRQEAAGPHVTFGVATGRRTREGTSGAHGGVGAGQEELNPRGAAAPPGVGPAAPGKSARQGTRTRPRLGVTDGRGAGGGGRRGDGGLASRRTSALRL